MRLSFITQWNLFYKSGTCFDLVRSSGLQKYRKEGQLCLTIITVSPTDISSLQQLYNLLTVQSILPYHSLTNYTIIMLMSSVY